MLLGNRTNIYSENANFGPTYISQGNPPVKVSSAEPLSFLIPSCSTRSMGKYAEKYGLYLKISIY